MHDAHVRTQPRNAGQREYFHVASSRQLRRVMRACTLSLLQNCHDTITRGACIKHRYAVVEVGVAANDSKDLQKAKHQRSPSPAELWFLPVMIICD